MSYRLNLETADALILDCDGTLINVNNSYNACIKYTVGFTLELLFGKSWYDLVTDDLIQAFRATGGFNNDIDTCYACILAAITNNDIDDARTSAFKLAERADARGIVSVEEQLKMDKPYIDYKELASIFDEFFYGRELFKKIYNEEPKYGNKDFIKYDEVIISDSTLDILKSIFDDKIAIVSGRSKIATEYALKDMLNKFNIQASVFIEDEERNGNKIGKPDPYSIIRSMNIMDTKRAICVGDSVEDLIMSRNAVKQGYNVKFVGVYDNGLDDSKQLAIFKEMNADAIIRDINLLPELLDRMK